MKWLDITDAPEEVVENKKEKYTARFSKKEDNGNVSLSFSKAVQQLAEKNGFTHVRFGVEVEKRKRRIGFLFLSEEKGICASLVDKKGKYKASINVTHVVPVIESQKVEIPFNETHELDLKVIAEGENELTVLSFNPKGQALPARKTRGKANAEEANTDEVTASSEEDSSVEEETTEVVSEETVEETSTEEVEAAVQEAAAASEEQEEVSTEESQEEAQEETEEPTQAKSEDDYKGW